MARFGESPLELSLGMVGRLHLGCGLLVIARGGFDPATLEEAQQR